MGFAGCKSTHGDNVNPETEAQAKLDFKQMIASQQSEIDTTNPEDDPKTESDNLDGNLDLSDQVCLQFLA